MRVAGGGEKSAHAPFAFFVVTPEKITNSKERRLTRRLVAGR